MKPICKFVIIFLFLNVVFACSNESILNQDLTKANPQSVIENNDSIQTLSYCYGCLPMISANHDPFFNQFVIAWSGYSDLINHPATVSYTVDGVSGSKSLDYNSGEIRENIYSESYLATWSIRCGNYDCSACQRSGSILKKASGETEVGSATACHKEYLSYSIEKVYNYSNTFELVLNDNNGNLENTEKFMSIDAMRIYKIDGYPGREEEVYGAGSLNTSSGTYRLRFSLSNQEMFKNFKIAFYSSKCKNNYEHYYYTHYRFSNNGAELSGSSLTLVNNH